VQRFSCSWPWIEDEAGNDFIYDAWNRMVEVQDSGETTIASYEFDALGRRVVETVDGTTRDLFYSDSWQVLEEREGSAVKVQYVWSPFYIDSLILRDRDEDGSAANGLEERVYVQQDANHNVTALIDDTGAVVERAIYDAYGRVTFLSPSWNSLTNSAYESDVLFQGGRHANVIEVYHFRNRDLNADHGRWQEVDPLGFEAGDSNLYRFVINTPTNHTDPFGLQHRPGNSPAFWMAQRPEPINVLQRLFPRFFARPTNPTIPRPVAPTQCPQASQATPAVTSSQVGSGVTERTQPPPRPPRRPRQQEERPDCFCWLVRDHRHAQYIGHMSRQQCAAAAVLAMAINPGWDVRWQCTAGSGPENRPPVIFDPGLP